jgi:hypothetical protein
VGKRHTYAETAIHGSCDFCDIFYLIKSMQKYGLRGRGSEHWLARWATCLFVPCRLLQEQRSRDHDHRRVCTCQHLLFLTWTSFMLAGTNKGGCMPYPWMLRFGRGNALAVRACTSRCAGGQRGRIVFLMRSKWHQLELDAALVKRPGDWVAQTLTRIDAALNARRQEGTMPPLLTKHKRGLIFAEHGDRGIAVP